MTQTIVSPEQEILSKLQELEPHRLEQVLDFVEFLLSRQHQNIETPSNHKLEQPISALESAGDLVGCLEAPSNLSMQKKLFKQKAIAE